MTTIKFHYECWAPIGDVEVITDENGKGIIVIQDLTSEEIPWEYLRDSDKNRIKCLVKEWIDHYKAMKEKDGTYE